MPTPKLLILSGSARKDSLNIALAKIAQGLAEKSGAETTFVDHRATPLPLYDGDEEAAHGLPENVLKLKDVFKAHDGFIIASPEYNSSITPLLKNTIDWVSRPREGESALECFKGKTALLLAASPGALGGLRGLVHVRAILGNIGVLVLPDQVAIPKAHEVLKGGALEDEGLLKRIAGAVEQMVRVTGSLKA